VRDPKTPTPAMVTLPHDRLEIYKIPAYHSRGLVVSDEPAILEPTTINKKRPENISERSSFKLNKPKSL